MAKTKAKRGVPPQFQKGGKAGGMMDESDKMTPMKKGGKGKKGGC